MSLGLSPSIHIEEEDFQNATIVPGANFAAIAGDFSWGPANSIVTITNEAELVNLFGKPSDRNYLDWMAASSYLAYNDKLRVVRAIHSKLENSETDVEAKNAGTMVLTSSQVQIEIEAVLKTGETDEYEDFEFEIGDIITSGTGIDEKTGTIIAIKDNISKNTLSIDEDSKTKILLINTESTFATNDEITSGENKAKINTVKSVNSFEYNELKIDNIDMLEKPAFPELEDKAKCKFLFIAKYPGIYEKQLAVRFATSSAFSSSSLFKNQFGLQSIKENQMAIQVGYMSSTTFVPFEEENFIVSLEKGTMNEFGRSDFIENYINTNSQYIYCFLNPDSSVEFTSSSIMTVELTGGMSPTLTVKDYTDAYEQYASSEQVDIDVIFSAGMDSLGISGISYVVDLVLKRKDCRYVISSRPSDIVGLTKTNIMNNLISGFTSGSGFYSTILGNNSYTAFYGNAKYMYDKYNDTYRWVSIAGDIAGIYTQTTMWMAPAGVKRGIIKNAVKLAFNPSEPDRDDLYPLNINPVYTIRGVGHTIFGQKTLYTSSQSIFNRVDNRGLFIYLEKNTMQYLRAYQFEKNNQETRINLVNEISPVFDYVLARGGIAAYRITCDDTNNPNSYSNVLYVDAAVQIVGSIEWIVMKFRAVPNMVNVVEQE